MLESFAGYLQFEKRYSPHTAKSYMGDLKQLSEWLSENYEISEIDRAAFVQLRTWVATMVESGLEPKTVHRKVSSAKAYFRWLRKYHGLQADPSRNLSLPKVGRKLPVYVEEEQMELLLNKDQFSNDFEGQRDYAIIELFYQTGIRCAELIGLKTFDVDFEQSTLKVLGKRNKERIVPVGDQTVDILQSYIHARTEIMASLPSDLFVTSRGAKLYPRLVYKIVNSYLSRVSSLRKKSPHVLRHTFATHMLGRGADLNAIKEILGHTSLAATQVYTHNSIEQLKEVHRKAHPRG